MAVLSDSARVARPLTGSNEDQIAQLASEAKDLWEVTRPFCSSLQVAARWGWPEDLSPWVSGIKALVGATTRVEGGIEAKLQLRHVPGFAAITTAGIACTAAGAWANLGALLVNTSVRDRRNQSKSVSYFRRPALTSPLPTTGLPTRSLAQLLRTSRSRRHWRISLLNGWASTTRLRRSGSTRFCDPSFSTNFPTTTLTTPSSTGLRSCWGFSPKTVNCCNGPFATPWYIRGPTGSVGRHGAPQTGTGIPSKTSAWSWKRRVARGGLCKAGSSGGIPSAPGRRSSTKNSSTASPLGGSDPAQRPSGGCAPGRGDAVGVGRLEEPDHRSRRSQKGENT